MDLSRAQSLPHARSCAGICAAFVLSLAPACFGATAPHLEANGDPGAGYVTLSWSASAKRAENTTFRLERAPSPDFRDARVVYEGAQTATVLSGLSDGTHWFRVHDQKRATWSEPKSFEVRHHSIGLALGLFSVGGLVFATTAGFIFRAQLEARGDE